ncbi:MAG: NAD(+)/NADH kinase [Candidatus Bathyarchaeota archaeon]|nr:NAD(+)/NADH kinase [Candidatus Termiticorpusculum sp.]
MFKSAGIVARYDKEKALQLTEELSMHLNSKGIEVFIEDTLADKIEVQAKAVPLKEMKTDFIITIGGDGTILRTCLNSPKPEPLILGINMGVRGFLTEVEPNEACKAVDRILRGDFRIEKSTKLSAKIGEETLPDALNDVVISAGEPSKILYTEICKDGKSILKCQADGLIVATQTGSTGYSLSAGGPVLDKKMDAILVTPICALTVFRSLVFPTDSEITLNVIRPKQMLVMIDGNYHHMKSEKELTVKVTKSKNVSNFIRFENDFYDRLSCRLLFQGSR